MVWLTRQQIRKLEQCLKERFLDWLHNNEAKSTQVFTRLQAALKDEFEKRMKPFNMVRLFEADDEQSNSLRLF